MSLDIYDYKFKLSVNGFVLYFNSHKIVYNEHYSYILCKPIQLVELN